MKYSIRNTKIGETSTEQFAYSLRSHKRLTLLVEDVYIASSHTHIYPLHVSTSKIATCKMPNDVWFMYNTQPDYFTPIKDKVRYVRLVAGLSQKELAGLLGIDRVTLTRLENGSVTEENMRTDFLIQIATICGFDKIYCCNNYHTFIANDAGKQIRKYRREKNLTQIQLAQMLNVAHATVKRWERNESKPPIEKVKEMFPHVIGA